MSPSISYGINVPNFGDYHSPRVLADLAVSAEEAGWDGFFIWDHIEGEMPFCDPTVALSAIALQTERIRLGAMITPLPRRRPWKVAREMAKFGEEPEARVRAEKLDESLDIITGLWSGELFSYEGNHYNLEEVTFQPRPLQEPRIPIWVGGFWPNRPPFRRAARYDGVYPAMNWPDTLTTAHLRTLLEYIGRHRKATLPYDVIVGGSTPGDPKKGAEVVGPWVEAGATWWSEDINGWRGSLEEMRERIRQGPPRA